jgi:putative autoinducer-2 (AI-2) aldolase
MLEYMSWGKLNRMRRILQADNRVLMLAIDHGYFMGPTTGMEVPSSSIAPLLPYIDSLMLSPGILTSQVDAAISNVGWVLRASGGNSILDDDIDNERLILSALQAIRLNASAIAVSIYIGAEHQHQTIGNLTTAIQDASQYELPVLAVTAVGKKLHDKREKRYLALASRIAAELGADMVKTYYCEGFEEVVVKTPVPIVVAGGPKLDTYKDVLELTYNSIQSGAVGVDMGRNIWQSEYPAAIIQGVRSIIHDGYTVREALQLVESLQTDENRRQKMFTETKEDLEASKIH